jgi:hypothetical protein
MLQVTRRIPEWLQPVRDRLFQEVRAHFDANVDEQRIHILVEQVPMGTLARITRDLARLPAIPAERQREVEIAAAYAQLVDWPQRIFETAELLTVDPRRRVLAMFVLTYAELSGVGALSLGWWLAMKAGPGAIVGAAFATAAWAGLTFLPAWSFGGVAWDRWQIRRPVRELDNEDASLRRRLARTLNEN